MKISYQTYAKIAAIAVGLTLVTRVTVAQNRPVPKVDPQNLGTSARAAGVFNPSMDSATRLALPAYDDQSLGSMIQDISKKYANGLDPLVINLDAIETLFQIKATGEGSVQETDYSYQISKKEGRIYLYRNRGAIKPYSLAKGALELRLAAQTHPAMLRLFGLDKGQFSSYNSNLILIEGIQKLENGGFGRPTTPLVDNIYSYAQRSIDGIMADGSYIKVLSKDAHNPEGLIINWPRFQVHPGLQTFDVKSKADIMAEVNEYIKRVANPKHELNVKMAVVFRPVMMEETRVFVPSMKVGLYSRPTGDTLADEKGENGALFYVDLMKQALKYTERADTDVETDEQK